MDIAIPSLTKAHGGRIDRNEIRRRCGHAMARKLPLFLYCQNMAREWVVVGAGPSANDHIDTIWNLKKRGAAVITVNKTHDWALEHGIVPWAHVMLDPMDWVAEYVQRPRQDVRYFIASQCHEKVFDALKDYPTFLWHAGQDFGDESEPFQYLKEMWPKTGHAMTMLGGGTTVGLRVPMIGQVIGPISADKFHMIGFDSSRRDGKLHAMPKQEAKDAESGNVSAKHKNHKYVFSTNSHMLRQAEDFEGLIASLPEAHRIGRLRKQFNMTFYGSGLLPFRAAQLGLHADPECNADPSKVGGYIETKEIKYIGLKYADNFDAPPPRIIHFDAPNAA